jgi:hypothetical protein
MTPLEDHIARAEATGSYVLEVSQDIPGEVDPNRPADPGFVMMLRDHRGRIMLAELSIAADGSGLSAVISTYTDDGEGFVASVVPIGNQVLVTVE